MRLDEAYLVRLFKAAVGIPPMAYLARIRVERAVGLLLHTPAPVSDIGRRVGWSDPNYFARRFRAHTGLSPTAYRDAGREVEPNADA